MEWKSRGSTDEHIKALGTSNNIFNLSSNYVDSKIRVEFKGSCLKQDNFYSIMEKSQYLQYLWVK